MNHQNKINAVSIIKTATTHRQKAAINNSDNKSIINHNFTLLGVALKYQ